MTSELLWLEIELTFSSTKHRGRKVAMVLMQAQNVSAAASAHAWRVIVEVRIWLEQLLESLADRCLRQAFRELR